MVDEHYILLEIPLDNSINEFLMNLTDSFDMNANDSIQMNSTDLIQTNSNQLETWILTVLISLMTFITVSGNSLVIIAFIREPRIRTHSNYFILNLSIADLLIGVICIPLYAHRFIVGEWYFGYHLCKIWLVFDYVVGSASTLCIVVISYDRYQMVSGGLAYFSSVNLQRALKFMLGTWTIATLNYGPAIILWDWLPGSKEFDYRSCGSPFAKNFPFLVTTAFVEFFVPFFSLTTLNLLVYLNVRQRSRGLVRSGDKKSKMANGQGLNGSDEKRATLPELVDSKNFSKSSTASSLARDRRAAKKLFILVFVFVLCWCPYTLFTLIRALCKQEDACIPSSIYEITFWLLWFNSTINPLLYSFLHVKFRKAFYDILCFSKRSTHNRL